MGLDAALFERTDRPAYVRFKRVAVEDKAKSLELGRYAAKDIDFALITPPYSKDVIEIKVSQWFANLEQDLRNERIPPAWVAAYKDGYEKWKNGQEIPLQGTPIRGWGVISPAQQETLIRMNVLTVEDLGGINDEGIKRFGMGGVELKHKANAWLKQLKDKGAFTQEMSALKVRNEQLEKTVESLTAKVEALLAASELKRGEAAQEPAPAAAADKITASDILGFGDEEPEVKPPPGKRK